jgi:signal-transduction protein with cAMP-binding, CBS, and nucleotidyltransferase domain
MNVNYEIAALKWQLNDKADRHELESAHRAMHKLGNEIVAVGNASVDMSSAVTKITEELIKKVFALEARCDRLEAVTQQKETP